VWAAYLGKVIVNDTVHSLWKETEEEERERERDRISISAVYFVYG